MKLLSEIFDIENCDRLAEKINEQTIGKEDFDANESPYYEGEDLRAHVGEVDEDGDFLISIYPKNIPDGTRPLAFIACSFKGN
jgi:hypothetical protein